MRMIQLVPAGRLVSEGAHSRAIPILRDTLLIAAAGFVAAWVGPLLGRHVRVGLAMPLAGSVVATLPRALIVLMVLWRVNRTGVLTATAIARVLAGLTMGVPGLLPMALVVPVVAAAVADALWRGTKGWHNVWLRLAATGGVLAGTRVATAWMLLVWAIFPPQGMRMPATATCCAIMAVNVLLGAAAGTFVAGLRRYRSGGREE